MSDTEKHALTRRPGRTCKTLLALILMMAGISYVIIPGMASADAGLQINPLKYEDAITGATVRQGFIDVGNPSDTAVTIRTSVKGFRQADLDGNLEFFDDPVLAEAIRPDLGEFQLGPRESLRMSFTIDPTKLKAGGVYAAVFFQTVPPPGSGSETFVSESARVGTLLMLEHGAAIKSGTIGRLSIPWLQIGGGGITGTVRYANTGGGQAAAITPALSSRIFGLSPMEAPTKVVLPGATRVFAVTREGTFLGILPVTLRDAVSGASRTQWVLAVTGGWAWIGLVLILMLCAVVLWRGLRHIHHLRHHYDWKAHAAAKAAAMSPVLPAAGEPEHTAVDDASDPVVSEIDDQADRSEVPPAESAGADDVTDPSKGEAAQSGGLLEQGNATSDDAKADTDAVPAHDPSTNGSLMSDENQDPGATAGLSGSNESVKDDVTAPKDDAPVQSDFRDQNSAKFKGRSNRYDNPRI